MNLEHGLQRKIVYIVLIVLLLIPLSYLGQPAGRTSKDQASDTDFRGKLAQMREEYNISQASLGEIDPTSATMQQLLFGQNCIAVSQLSEQAHEFQKKEDWESLRATLEQIVKLQPNYFKVWDYQAHNLSYNLSPEFDDFRARYKQVTVGFNFLKDGIALNKNEPRLPHRLGWYIGHKIGRADEKVFYRQLFQKDWMELFHKNDDPDRPIEKRDNWLVAKEKYEQGIDLADTLERRGIELRTTPSLFYKEPWQAMMSYAEAVIEDGLFQAGKDGWRIAKEEIDKFARRPFPIKEIREVVTAGELETIQNELNVRKETFEKMLPGVREKLISKRVEAITTPAIKAAFKSAQAKAKDELTKEELELITANTDVLMVPWHEMADNAPDEETRTEAKRLANEIIRREKRHREVDMLRDPLNYNYWYVRALAENTPAMQNAHRFVFEGKQLSKQGNHSQAIKAFDQGWCAWREVLNTFDWIRNDSISTDEIYDDIEIYSKSRRTLLKESLPENFVLADVVEVHVNPEKTIGQIPKPPLCGADTSADKPVDAKTSSDNATK